MGLILPISWHSAVSSPKVLVITGQRSSAAFRLWLLIFVNLHIVLVMVG